MHAGDGMPDRDDAFCAGAENGLEQAGRIRGFRRLLRNDDVVFVPVGRSEEQFHHDEILGHGVQAFDPCGAGPVESPRRCLREPVVREHRGHTTRNMSKRAKQLLGQVLAPAARRTDDEDEAESLLHSAYRVDVPYEQRDEQFICPAEVTHAGVTVGNTLP